jgi:hypothetical protein
VLHLYQAERSKLILYLVDEFTDFDGRPVFVIADVITEFDEDTGREKYKNHMCYFARMVAPETFYAYEKVKLGSNVDFEVYFQRMCEMKGACLYVSTKAQ